MGKKRKIVIRAWKLHLSYAIISFLLAGIVVYLVLQGETSEESGFLYAIDTFSFYFFMIAISQINRIIIFEDRIVTKTFPIAALPFRFKKDPRTRWNSNIDFSEIESVELVNLTHDERLELFGAYTFSNQFLKIDVKGKDRPKLIYISIYTEKQMNRLLDIINSIKTHLEEENAEY